MKLTYAEADRVYRHLSALKDEIGDTLSRPDRAVVMIGACIANGFDTKHQILKGLRSRGLTPNLFLRILDENTGDVPGLHLWRCDEDGTYRLHDEGTYRTSRIGSQRGVDIRRV